MRNFDELHEVAKQLLRYFDENGTLLEAANLSTPLAVLRDSLKDFEPSELGLDALATANVRGWLVVLRNANLSRGYTVGETYPWADAARKLDNKFVQFAQKKAAKPAAAAQVADFETAVRSYRKNKQLGEGGAGTVFLVHSEDGAEYAIKAFKESPSTEKRARFVNELMFGARNTHPNILSVVEYGFFRKDEAKIPFYVMPRYHCTLDELIKSGIAPDDRLRIFDQVLNGVEAAHNSGIYHRDLKPKNILCGSDGKIVIADWGTAHFTEDDLVQAVKTGNNDRLANFLYAAPEQKQPGSPVDHRADIFALGMILNELYTGTPPLAVGHKKIENIVPELRHLDVVSDSMRMQDPADRLQTIQHIKKACGLS